MKVALANQEWYIDLANPIELAILMDFSSSQPNAFGLPFAVASPFAAGDFVGDRSQGGPVNCFTFTMNPHGNGTHTESANHIHNHAPQIAFLSVPPMLSASVVTVPLEPRESTAERYPTPPTPHDQVVTKTSLIRATQGLSNEFLRALVLRTLPNDHGKPSRQHSGQHPGYFTLDAMEWVVEQNVEHLLVDLPSVDREEDQGKLAAHHMFWKDAFHKTITEMIFVPEHVKDGPYFLNLQVPRFALDAAPSRPLLFPISPIEPVSL